jgi:hypothetical protein
VWVSRSAIGPQALSTPNKKLNARAEQNISLVATTQAKKTAKAQQETKFRRTKLQQKPDA